MKTYFQIEEGPWFEGDVRSMSGARDMGFSSRDQRGNIVCDLVLRNVEIQVHNDHLVITGYEPVEDQQHTYRMVGVEVRYSKPKDLRLPGKRLHLYWNDPATKQRLTYASIPQDTTKQGRQEARDRIKRAIEERFGARVAETLSQWS